MIFLIYVILYLGIGLTIYFTLPRRNEIALSISLPFIIAWLPLSVVFLFHKEKPKDDK